MPAAGEVALWSDHSLDRSVGALYVHVPFCKSKCAYCDFSSRATSADDPLLAEYARAIEAQLEAFADVGLLDRSDTAYVGGGTPSRLGPALPPLVETIRRLCSPSELSCEANPESLDGALARSLARAGASRISLGVQSTCDVELRALGRAHDAVEALAAVSRARDAGLTVSCDLMCATPEQTDESWDRSVSDVIAAGADHVSVYPLAIEEGTAFGRRFGDDAQPWNDEDVQARRMKIAREILASCGFARYEVASYARPGRRCAHNIAYWTGVPYLGVGTAAAGMLTRRGYERLRLACPQLPDAPGGVVRIRLTVRSDARQIAGDPRTEALLFDGEFLSEEQAAAEDLMLGARLVDGVSPALLGHARDVFGPSRLDDTLESVLGSGLAVLEDGRLRPTESGWLLGNELYGSLWSLSSGEVTSFSA